LCSTIGRGRPTFIILKYFCTNSHSLSGTVAAPMPSGTNAAAQSTIHTTNVDNGSPMQRLVFSSLWGATNAITVTYRSGRMTAAPG
jgi:hypothetical protein